MLEHITVVILTFNEKPNIRRTLKSLKWAKTIIVLDSYSSDNTQEICAEFENVRFYQQEFKQHATQWNHAISLVTDSRWILTLDADHNVSPDLVDELNNLRPPDDVDIYSISYDYAIDGKKLSTSLYPPMKVLFRRNHAKFIQDGHTQQLQAKDTHKAIPKLINKIIHDDRKPYEDWLKAQHKYARLEVSKMKVTPFNQLSINDKIRNIPFVAPLIILPYMFIFKGLWKDGYAGWKYAKQRVVAEMILQKKLWLNS